MKWLNHINLAASIIHSHVRGLQKIFLNLLASTPISFLKIEQLVGYKDKEDWGNFLSFQLENAQSLSADLRKQNVFVDAREDILRIGFGYYHNTEDIIKLHNLLKEI